MKHRPPDSYYEPALTGRLLSTIPQHHRLLEFCPECQIAFRSGQQVEYVWLCSADGRSKHWVVVHIDCLKSVVVDFDRWEKLPLGGYPKLAVVHDANQ